MIQHENMNDLVPVTLDEEKIKKELRSTIKNRKKKLATLTTKYESLKMELDLIRHEYDVRIGRLYLKDNQLDFEIIRLQNIITLMQEGKSYYEAEVALEDAFFSEQDDFTKRSEEIDSEEEVLLKRLEKKDTELEIKQVWKKLIVKFHPDLTMDPFEKKEREEFMKKINAAYKENNLQALLSYDREQRVKREGGVTVDDLQELLSDIETLFHQTEIHLQDLLASEWYTWRLRMRKAKKKGEDVFLDFEKKLLDDIVKKITIVQGLRLQVQQPVVA